jgi:hypothetical protein
MVFLSRDFANQEFETHDSKFLSPQDPESRNAEMTKTLLYTSSRFTISVLLMWIVLPLVNGNVENPIPKMPTNILLQLLISDFPPC